MCPSEKELEDQLKEIGFRLLNPPSSTEDLLVLLDKAECLLTNVEQSPPRSTQDAFLPLMKALISDELLKNSDIDVRVSVTSCITEITRITAPDAPYDDEKMKVIFKLTVEAFEKLSNVSGRCYTKAMSILDAVSKVRSCLVMLDLECDDLILEMFQHFLKPVRSNHPHAVFTAMEIIMTTVLNESEEISLALLSPILASVKKGNQEVSPMSWKLGEKVISNCASKLQPYLTGAVKSVGNALDDYAPIVMTICQNDAKSDDAGVISTHISNVSVVENPKTDGVSEPLTLIGTVATRNANKTKASSRKIQRRSEQLKVADAEVRTEPDNLGPTKVENDVDSAPKKRGRKPNSLMNPEEGYDHKWITTGRKMSYLAKRRKSNDQESKIFTSVKLSLEKVSLPTEVEKQHSPRVEEKGIQSKEAVVGKTHEDTIKMDEKARRSLKKSRITKSKDKATLDSGCVASEDKFSAQSDCEEKKSGHLVMKLKVRSTNEDGSVIEQEYRMKSKSTNIDKEVNISSNSKKRVSRSSKLDRNDYLEETPKSEIIKKPATLKEEAMEISDAEEELVGRRIKVWWPLDRKFYEGVVYSFDPVKKKHKISYDDGDEELLNLKMQRYELIGGGILPVGNEKMDVLKPEASPHIRQTKKRKTKSESANKDDLGSSTRRNRASAKEKSLVKSSESSGKAPSGPIHEEPIASADDILGSDNSWTGNDKKLIDLIKVNKTKTTKNAKKSKDGELCKPSQGRKT